MDTSTPDLHFLAARVEKLERQNRLLRRVGLTLLLSSTAVIVLGHGRQTFAQQPTPQPPPLTLGQVRSIYVSPMGGEFRNFVMQRLLKWSDIKLAASADDADAILTGAAESKDRVHGNNGDVTEAVRFSGEVTLLDRKTQFPIWSTEKGKHTSVLGYLTEGAYSGGPDSQSKLADQIVNQLRKDWMAAQAPPKKKKTP